jgi:hypothetical protein
MNDIEREKNRIKVAKYRARKQAREQGLDPDAPQPETAQQSQSGPLAVLSPLKAEKHYGNGYSDGYEDGCKDGYADGERDGYDVGFHEGYGEALEHSSGDKQVEQAPSWGMVALLLAVVLFVGLAAGTYYGTWRKGHSTPSLASSPRQQTGASA